MLSRELLRSDPERIRRAFIDRGQGPATLDEWLQIDAERRGAVTEIDELKRRRNEASREVGARKSKGEAADELMAEVGGIKARLESLEAALAGLDEQLAALEFRFPNLPDASVPVGTDETANRVERVVGTPREFDFEPKPHWDLGTDLGILDFERGAKVTGARFTVYYGAAARLERALISFMLDLHTGRHGYREVLPPFIVNRDSLVGTGQLPKFEPDLFHLEGTSYYLVPTAEVPLTNLHREEVLDESLLPMRYTAYTPCFRSEAGSYGKDVRGLIRQHQFNKVELVQLATPETSFAQLEEMTGHAERVLQLLELPYRVICLSTGDMGFSADQDLRSRGLAAVAEDLPRDLLVLELRRLPGAARQPALPHRGREAPAPAHPERLRPRRRPHPGRHPRELPAGRRLDRHPREAPPLPPRPRAHRQGRLSPPAAALGGERLPIASGAEP